MPDDPGSPRGARKTKRLAVFAGLMLTAAITANGYVLVASRGRVAASFETIPSRPYALVLGSSVSPAGAPMRDLAERLETARQLYRAGLVHRIIVSGAVRPGYDEPDAMAAWLVQRGVPAIDLVVDRGGYRTAASMADVAALGVDALLVVSQPYHLPRALYLAQHAGLQAIGVAARDPPRGLLYRLFRFLRETTARAEVIVEVALRGVRGLPADRIPQAPSGSARAPGAGAAAIANRRSLG